MAEFVGAIDQGTTSTRFIIFTKQGRLLASYQLEHEQIYPKPGWVEHDPDEIWQNYPRKAKDVHIIQGNRMVTTIPKEFQ